jgi:hypothetical protein
VKSNAAGLVAVAAARVEAAEDPKGTSATKALRAALEEATRNGVSADQWEARLALAEIEPAVNRPVVRTRLQALAQEAQAQGHGLYALYGRAAAIR